MRFLADREGRLSHHKRAGWFSPWQAAWINLRAMFIYGSDFFVLKPGTRAGRDRADRHARRQLRQSHDRRGHAVAQLAVPGGGGCSSCGCQAFFLGGIAQVLFDFTGDQHQTMAAGFPVHPHRPARRRAGRGRASRSRVPLAVAYLGNDLALTSANSLQDHLAVTGRGRGHRRRPAVRVRAAAPRSGRRDRTRGDPGSPTDMRWTAARSSTPATTAGCCGGPGFRSPRDSRCRSCAARPCGPERTRWPIRSRPTRPGRPMPSFQRVYQRGQGQHAGRHLALLRAVEPARRAGGDARRGARGGRLARRQRGADGGANGRTRPRAIPSTCAIPGRASSRPGPATSTTATASTMTPRRRSSKSLVRADGAHQRHAAGGRLPRGHRVSDHARVRCGSSTSTSTSTSPPRTCSTGRGPG